MSSSPATPSLCKLSRAACLLLVRRSVRIAVATAAAGQKIYCEFVLVPQQKLVLAHAASRPDSDEVVTSPWAKTDFDYDYFRLHYFQQK